MMKIRYFAATLAIAAMAGLSTAHTQQGTLGQPTLQQNQTAGSQNDQGDRYEARRVSSDSRMTKQQGLTVKQAIVQKLIKANEAEIELAKMAQEQTNNEELKQLASLIVQDHQQLNQQLKQMSGDPYGSQSRDVYNPATNRRFNPAQTRDASRLTADRQQDRKSASHATVPQELCEVTEQACDNALKMTKDMLGNYEGQDFNMAFLGQQCVAHTMMLAELKAIESSGPQEIRQFANRAATKVEKHLREAKQLAKQFEDDRRNQS